MQKFRWFIKKEFKGKLARTNNLSEIYFHVILPKPEKNDIKLKQKYLIRDILKKSLDGKPKIPTDKLTHFKFGLNFICFNKDYKL